jgi:predicted dehydrogenase
MKKIAIIGCGGIGTYHLGNLMGFDDIDLVGFCDLIPEKAEGFAKKAGCGKVFTDFRKMYDETKPDMVFICVPPYCHDEIDFDTIERGIHLFVEKPMALDLDFSREVRDRIASKNLVSAVGLQLRYDNLTDGIKNYIKDNEIVTVQASRISHVPAVEWFRKKELSGGQLVEMTIHQIDLLRYLLGDIETVYSVPTRGFIKDDEHPGYNIEDASTSIFTFKSGISGTMITGCYDLDWGSSWDSKITLGSRASRLDYHVASSVRIFAKDGKELKPEGNNYGPRCDRAFIDAAASGSASDIAKIRSPYSDAVKSLAVVLGCNESMRTGKPVKIEA